MARRRTTRARVEAPRGGFATTLLLHSSLYVYTCADPWCDERQATVKAPDVVSPNSPAAAQSAPAR